MLTLTRLVHVQFSHLIAVALTFQLVACCFSGFKIDSSESTPNQLAEGSPCHHQLGVFSKQYLWNTSMHVGAYIRTNSQKWKVVR